MEIRDKITVGHDINRGAGRKRGATERDMPICIKSCYNVLPANDAYVKTPCLWSMKYWYYMPHFSKCLPIIK